MPRLLSWIKNRLLSERRRLCTVQSGALRGLRVRLSLHHQTQVWLGLAERELQPDATRFAAAAVTALDVGAAEGLYTLLFLSQKQVRTVIAIDGAAEFPERLLDNLALNRLEDTSKLQIVKKQVGALDDDRHVCLDTLAADLAGPIVVKIDVEGAERDALLGAARLLARRDVAWLIETHSLDLERDCERLLQDAGPSTRIVDKAWWRLFLPERRPILHNRWLVAWPRPV